MRSLVLKHLTWPTVFFVHVDRTQSIRCTGQCCRMASSSASLAVVTGGIGKAIVIEYAKNGYNVLVNGRSQTTVDKVVQEVKQQGGADARVFGVAGDIGTDNGAKKFIEDVDSICSSQDLHVEMLVNNAGIFEVADFFEVPDSTWQRYFEVNFFSSMRLSRHWIQGMLQRKHGRIIMISSEAGVRIIPDMLHYSITKQMQIGLGRGLAQLTKGTGVTVNTILPGPTWTEGVQGYIEGLAEQQKTSMEEATKNYFKQREPTSLIQRFIKPEEVAATALFLITDGAAAINGAAVRCEGGLVAHV